MLFLLFVAGYLTCAVGAWLVNHTTEYKQRRQVPINEAYRAGYFAGWTDAQKQQGAAPPPAPTPPGSPPPNGQPKRTRLYWRGQP